MDDYEIAEEVLEQTECLWELIISYLHGIKINTRSVLRCAIKLNASLKTYEARGLNILEPHELWFTKQVLREYAELRSEIYA